MITGCSSLGSEQWSATPRHFCRPCHENRSEVKVPLNGWFGCVAQIGDRVQRLQPRPGLGDADVVRASQFQHAVEGLVTFGDLAAPYSAS